MRGNTLRHGVTAPGPGGEVNGHSHRFCSFTTCGVSWYLWLESRAEIIINKCILSHGFCHCDTLSESVLVAKVSNSSRPGNSWRPPGTNFRLVTPTSALHYNGNLEGVKSVQIVVAFFINQFESCLSRAIATFPALLFSVLTLKTYFLIQQVCCTLVFASIIG